MNASPDNKLLSYRLQKAIRSNNTRLLFPVIFILLIVCGSCNANEALSVKEKMTAVYSMYEGYRTKEFPDVPDIHPKEALALLESQPVIFVDTRTKAEMAVSMLPDAIPQSKFLAHPESYKNKLVIAYCTIGYRSGKFAQEMKPKGIRVRNLAGGILAWVLEGGKIYNSDGETKKMHVYGKQWDYPASGYRSVKFGLFQRLFGP